MFNLGVIIDGDYKVVVGSHSVLRRKASDYQTVWLYNIKEDPQEANDLRFNFFNFNFLNFLLVGQCQT